MYLARRDTKAYHSTYFDYSAASSKDMQRDMFHEPRAMSANDGVVIRTANLKNDNDAEYDASIIYGD